MDLVRRYDFKITEIGKSTSGFGICNVLPDDYKYFDDMGQKLVQPYYKGVFDGFIRPWNKD